MVLEHSNILVQFRSLRTHFFDNQPKEPKMRVSSTGTDNKTLSMKKRSLITTAATLCASALTAIPSTNAFAPQQPIMMGARLSSSQLAARSNGIAVDESNAESSRRDVLKSSVGAFFAGLTLAASIDVEPASASYSAYTNREKDWEQRQKSGDIKVSTARDLRNQLREIVPQNSEGSKIFCPNGPSAAVSPMMENKCGDRMATASVFGRTEDTVGNSIPGFNGGKYPGVGGGASGLAAADTGGFLSYSDAGQTPGRANNRLVAR